MQELESVKAQLDYAVNMAMKTLDKAISLIPDDKLNWKPIDEAMTSAELGIHIYQCALINTAGTLKGEFNNEDYDIIPFNPKTINSSKEIVEYGEKVKQFIRETVEKLTEEDMIKEITYNCWGGVKMRGFTSLSSILEEIIHHRGQLCLYLRMMGIKPPFIYDFS
ncbi:MAG: DinB family protein [Candidatus Heimdallarchaeota archaeon]|nr:MAG: DinB family protein [Candidatus Heimdallarchaeota archaeon]